MPVSAETLRLLMDAGVEGDELLRIVESIDNTPKQRSANAERQARFRARQKEASVTNNVTSNVTESVTPRVRVEDNLQTNKQTGKKTPNQDRADFEAELSSILDAERVSALMDVRRKKGGKINAYSARLLVAKITACGLSPSEAADTMVLRNWISIERDWLRRDGPPSTATSPPRKQTVGQQARDELKRMGLFDDTTSPQTRHIDQSDGSPGFAGTGIARRIAIASSR